MWEGDCRSSCVGHTVKLLIQGTELGGTGNWYKYWSYFANYDEIQVFLQ